MKYETDSKLSLHPYGQCEHNWTSKQVVDRYVGQHYIDRVLTANHCQWSPSVTDPGQPLSTTVERPIVKATSLV